MDARRERLSEARLYLVCDEQPEATLSAALAGGVDIVQLRMKGADAAAVQRAGEHVGALCRQAGALFVVNDDPELAVALDADGVHIGQDDLSPDAARAIVGPERIIGLSTHTPAQIEAAAGAGVDYIGVGPVHATPTKPGRPAVGLELVAWASAHATPPFFAIGGIDPGNAAAVVGAGARRLAVVRAITAAADPGAAARGLREVLAPARAEVVHAGS